MTLLEIGVPVRAEDQQRCRPSATCYGGDQVEGWPVSPVQVLDGENERTVAGQRVEQVKRLSKHPFRRRSKCAIDQRGPMININQCRQLQQPPWRDGIETTQSLLGGGPLCKIKYRLKHRGVGLTGANGMALSDADQLHGSPEPGQERLHNRRLTNTGLTADQHQLTGTGLSRRQGGPQRGKFGVTPDEAGPGCLRW